MARRGAPLLGGEQLMAAVDDRVARRLVPRPARLAWIYFRVGAMNELQYRANFFIEVFRSLLSLGTGLVVLALVFSKTPELNGWSRPELLVVLGVQIMVGGVIRAMIQPNLVRLMDDVHRGTLDFVLTKPEDAQVLVSVRDYRIWQSTDIVSGVVVLAVAFAQLDRGMSAIEAVAFVIALGLGVLMLYCFWLMLTTASFWFVRIDQIVEMFDGVFQTGRWPIGTYPGWLRFGLTFLVPIAFAVTVPAEAFTSRLNGWTLLAAAGVAALLVVASRWLWRRGLTHYSGASA
jgi:ABC-2 type transport system permease protein